MGVIQAVAVGEDTIPLALCLRCRLRRGHKIVFPVRDRRDQLLKDRLIIFDQPLGEILKQRDLIGIIKERKVRFHAQRGVFALDDIQPQGVESGDHQAARLFTPQGLAYTLFHLTCGFVGKGHRRDMPGLVAAAADQMRYLVGNDAGFTGSSSCQYQAGSGDKFDGLLLPWI